MPNGGPKGGGRMAIAACNAARSIWGSVSDAEWNDWKWQLRNSVKTKEQLEKVIELKPEEEEGLKLPKHKLSMAITPYIATLIDPQDPNCPIRKQFVPNAKESIVSPLEMTDPCGEDSHTPVPGLVHRYPDRVLMIVTNRCAVYCRYCTRSRIVGEDKQYLFIQEDFDRACDYLEKTPVVRDVLISGGDPLLLSDAKIEYMLKRLRAIKHIEFLRIGSRIPFALPQRITPEFCEMIRRYHPVWMSVHVNHPKEVTPETKAACERLADAGIPLGSQSVLIRGVNDSVEVMKELMHKLLMCRVRPYYIYQCDLVKGTTHMRTSVQKGIEIIEGLRGHTTGYAVPTYVIDGPGGGGKIPINPNYIVSMGDGKVILRNFKGEIFEYPEYPDA